MDQISTQIDRLKSTDPDVRFDACEELRVASTIPQSAVDALLKTTSDADELVADAARRALAMHSETGRQPSLVTEQPMPRDVRMRIIALLGLMLITWVIVAVALSGSLQWENFASTALFFPFLPTGWLWFFWTGDNHIVDYSTVYAMWFVYLGLTVGVLMSREKRLARAFYVVLAVLVLVNAYGCVQAIRHDPW